MKHRLFSRLLAVVLFTALVTLGLAPEARAIASPFFQTHQDWHFDLSKEPNRPMTVEELIALSTSYSYWTNGTDAGTTPRDKNGDLPAAWAAPYIRYYAQNKNFDPSRVDYDAPATLGFMMRFYASLRGKYSYDANNLYTFTGTAGYNAEELLLLSVAVDYGIVSYTPGMDVSRANLLRCDLESKYLIPTKTLTPRPTVQTSKNYPWSMAFFEDTYDYFGDAEKERDKLREFQNLQAAGGNINLVNLNVQVLNQNGSDGHYVMTDRVPLRQVHQELIDYCKQNGVKILCGVTNYYNATTLQAIKDRPAAAEEIADELVGYVDTYDFDGLDIDIEMFGNTYRAEYSALLRALSARMRARDKLLVATVGAYFTDAGEAASLYDYDVIRDTCDLVTLILYDDHSAQSYNNSPQAEAGFVSHYEGIHRRLTYAVTRLGADKVIMSVSTYGVDFNLSDHTAVNLNRQQIDALLASTGAQVRSHGMPIDDTYFAYTDAQGMRHEVYYDSDAAIGRRLSFATQYALGGAYVYYLLSDTPEVYDRMGEKLVDLPFRDVEKGWYYEAVRWAVEKGVTAGTSATGFSPDTACTRAQIVTFLWRAQGSPEPTSDYNPFNDVSPGDYYYKAVLWAVEQGVTAGTSTATFSPGAPCTRSQVVTFLHRALGQPVPTGTANPFSDVVSGDYYYDAVLWAVEQGVTKGTDASRFSPNTACTRSQIVTFLFRSGI